MPKKLTAEEREERLRCNRIRAMLRRAWSRDPERFRCIKDGRRKYKGVNKKQRFEYQCAMCLGWFKQSEIQVDHIIPCGSFLKLTQLGEFAYKLFCGDLQRLCKPCHKGKTNSDNILMKLERMKND